MNTEFAGKLVRAMQAMANPKKDKTATVPTKSGGKYTYKYTQLDDVIGVIRPPLLENGLVMLQGVEVTESGMYLTCRVTDGTCVEVLDRRRFDPKGDPQQQGSYETYMRRYQLLTAFGLAGEDDDGASASPQSQGRMYQQRAQQPAQQQVQQQPVQQQQSVKPPWNQLLDLYYGTCRTLDLDANVTWGELVRDIGFEPDPTMGLKQLEPAFQWVARMQG